MVRQFTRYSVLIAVLIALGSLITGCGGGGGGGGGGGSAPAAPTGVTVSLPGGANVTLHWNAVSDASSYRVYRGETPGVTRSQSFRVYSGTTATFTDTSATGLALDMTYYYIVTAVGAYESAASQEVGVTVAKPHAPATVLATASSGTTTATVDLAWSAVAGASFYTVWKSDVGVLGPYTQLTASTSFTSIADTAVSNGTTYHYIVTATNIFGEGPDSPIAAATPAAAAATSLSVSGTIQYEDREYNAAGYTGATSFKAVRYAEVELVDSAAGSVISGGTGTTGSNGSYSLSVSNTNKGKNVYVRVKALARPEPGQNVAVKTMASAIYAVKTATFALSGATSANLSIPVTNQADGAFNILDVYTSGFQMVNAHTLPSELMNNSQPRSVMSLNAFWQLNNQYGTYYCLEYDATYCPGNKGIYILSNAYGDGDTDDFDDDVLLHEFGHFVGDAFSVDDSPGGTHYLDDNTQPLTLSWSEGWGNFFQGGAKYWINANDPSLVSLNTTSTNLSRYVDTVNGVYYISLDIENPENAYPEVFCAPGACIYSSNEVAVASMLWNTMIAVDAANPLGTGMNNIWRTIDDFGTSHPVSVETFRDGFVTKGFNAEFGAALAARSIDYTDDAYEILDDVIATAPTYTIDVTTPQSHTLFGYLDLDYILFTNPSHTSGTKIYTIATGSLKNAADTYIELYQDNCTTWVDNDAHNDNYCAAGGMACPNYDTTYISGGNYNLFDAYGDYIYPPNDGTTLSSKLIRSLNPGTYCVLVKSTEIGGVWPDMSGRPVTAGKYGSYTLTITSSP